MRYSRSLLGFLVIGLASVIGGSLAPSKHKAVSEDVQQAQDFYYMLMFSSENNSNRARFSHSFASFVKATGPAPSSAECAIVETHTISWLPQSLEIVLLRRRPEPGQNLDLQETMKWAQSVRATISMWGPYQIQKELYDRAVEQETRLKSGTVMYKAADEKFRPATARN